ncbi:MAG: hypothetical protein HY597_06210 [Candidatus Omnitrophica bacterium]|nr:hypothetical protein [Candidatus Omnitrophota bacterium]
MGPRRSEQGFSIFESVIATGLFAVIVAFTFSVLSVARDSWSSGNSMADLQFESERALRRMASELRHAMPSQVTITLSANRDADSLRFAVPTDGADADSSVLSATTHRLEHGNQIEYYYDSAKQQIERHELDANGTEVVAPIVVANGIKALRFDGENGQTTQPTSLTATVTSEKALRPQAPSTSLRQFTAKEEVHLRNSESNIAIVYGPAPTTNTSSTTTGLTPLTTTIKIKGKTVTTITPVTPTS